MMMITPCVDPYEQGSGTRAGRMFSYWSDGENKHPSNNKFFHSSMLSRSRSAVYSRCPIGVTLFPPSNFTICIK